MWLIELLKWLGEQVLLEKVSPLFFVYQYQKGVILRRGIFLRTVKAGWNRKLPITDRYHVVNAALETMFITNVNITTADNKPCTVSCCFEYVIEDEKKWLLDANDAESNIKDISMGVVADILFKQDWEDIRKRKTINSIVRDLNNSFEGYGATVKRFWFTDLTQTRVFTLFNQ